MKEECTHEELNPVLCIACKTHLRGYDIEILNQYYDIAGFCNNEACVRYLLLVSLNY